ncbi:hypothetical protein SG34_030610 [Thalassomonas viridans]|uniref:Uncharacterized protein n=1 Tax=Thalassomonas viridans TaxID=137584 RepID=A0AAF0CDY4_9GAMM|nr:hypothetical protein [Thalassomonas viridans]WDE09121.1 hypothetical protein SG34_030610 [Thalassomonas viridans]
MSTIKNESILKLALIFAIVAFAIASRNTLLISIVFSVSIMAAMLMNRHDINIVYLCTGFIIVKIIERALFTLAIEPGFSDVYTDETKSTVWLGAVTFATHFIIDLILFYMVLLRAPFTRARLAARNKPTDKIRMYKAEVAFASLFSVFMFIDLLALVENFIRHLDAIGFSMEVAQKFSGWTWVYYHYLDMKSILTGCAFMLLWSMSTEIAREQYHRQFEIKV